MQKLEFDKMFMGEEAKWADFKQVKSLANVLSPDKRPNSAILRQAVQQIEEPIPAPTKEQIDGLISKLRADGYKESKIRRIVKNTFKITVI